MIIHTPPTPIILKDQQHVEFSGSQFLHWRKHLNLGIPDALRKLLMTSLTYSNIKALDIGADKIQIRFSIDTYDYLLQWDDYTECLWIDALTSHDLDAMDVLKQHLVK